MNSLCRYVSHTARTLRHINRHNRCIVAIHRVQRLYSNEAVERLPPPQADGEAKQYPEKIVNLVNDISRLTVIEIAELNELLKITLKIQDVPMTAMATTAVGPAAGAEAEEEEDAEPKTEKTHFTIKLTKFDAASKVKLIKEIKSLTTGMNLVQAKKFVESAPQVVKADISKEEAEETKKKLEAAGGEVLIE
ncbi:large ribosomal subunit protein bL12m-like [Saccoglossus kowalevskii]|uniref:39S ribosomal protein L12, mitochondrial-like n=1 Tax=Saccoglossus kowalevskii TaxID=10224 RepID=A0ABM0GSD7_SACKO|nr:PREDICTED: 39S ribosomal protein L12, mitochondrial-like [Saccoglossus kowalevskii]